MGLAEHYADYKWVKVKRYDGPDPSLPAEENYERLAHHHEKETTFLINEIRKLAAMVDERDALLDTRKKHENPPGDCH